MECTVNKKKKRAYQCKLWGMALGDTALFILGCGAMISGIVPAAWQGVGALALIVLVCGFFPTYLLLIRGLTISGTERVFLQDDTIWYVNWDGDRGEDGVKYHFYKIWKVTDYQTKKDMIEVKAYVWYGEARMKREELPVSEDGRLGEIPGFEEQAERCQRSIFFCRVLDHEEELMQLLEQRKKQALKIE